MCRLFAMLSPDAQAPYRALVSAPNALVRQAQRCSDGCGLSLTVAGQTGERFVHWKAVESAAASARFRELARHRTRLLVGHLRYGTVGARDCAHTHPFVQPHLVLAFQGVLGKAWRRQMRGELAEHGDNGAVTLSPVQGQTSGELLTAWLSCWIQQGELADPSRVIRTQLARLVAAPAGITGLSLVAAQADRRGLRLYAFRCGPDAQAGPLACRQGRALVLASRPTDRAAGWSALPNGVLLSGTVAPWAETLTVHLAPLSA